MNTLQQDIIDIDYMRSLDDTAEIAISTDLQDLDHPRWQLLRQLQTTLELKPMLSIFLNCVAESVKFDGALYEFHPLDISIAHHKIKRYHVEYGFKLNAEDYGKITFFRSTEFTSNELKLLEDFLCVLAHPLKNALLYQHALQSAQFDALTGINNRRGYEPALKGEWELAKRHHADLSLLIIDVDNFKQVNDNYGHSCGDYVLKIIAQLIQNNIRDSDLLYRYGGDEFCVILRNTPPDGALILAERVRIAIGLHTIHYKQAPIPATISIGVANARDCHSAEQMQEQADAALYRAKHDGKDLVSL